MATGARLRLWSRVWRYLLVLVIAIGGFSATLVAAFEAGDAVVRGSLAARLGGPEPLVVLDAAVGLAVMALLPWRRRAPVLVSVVTGLATGVSVTAAGPATLAAVSMATARDPVRLAVVGASWLTGGLLYEYLVVPSGMPLWTTVLAVVAGYAICAAIGMYVGARRELIATLYDRALTAERERSLHVAAAQAAERTRIAREMHDVLAHRISLVAMHAGGLAYRADLGRDETRQAATVIQDTARQALTELRQVLGVLRDDDTAAVEPPQPTLALLENLVEEVRAAGVEVEVASLPESGLASLPPVVSRTAYRIVQEALTNARKHAPGAPVRVAVSGRPGGLLTLEVRNRLTDAAGGAPTPGSGTGLTGLAERAGLAGGTLEHGTEPAADAGHEFVLRAWLPWEGEER